MEELPASRHGRRTRMAAAKTAYDDVFGGPPRHAVPFAGVPEDFSDIFGGVGASCFIPFLDLPPAAVASDGLLDYREIFSGSCFGDFAVPYEELFGEPPSEEAPPSRNGRKEKLNQENIESSALHQEYADKDHLPYLEEDQFTYTSLPSDEVLKQCKMSYNKTNQGRMEDLLVRTTCMSQPSTGFTYMVDSCNPLQNTQANNSSKPANGGTIQEERRKVCPAGSSSDSLKRSRSDFATDQKQHNSTCLPSVNGHADVNLHKCSSSNNSISDEEVVSPISFLSVFDISLQTRPLQVPPPSRPPPKLQNRQEPSMARKDVDSMKNVAIPAKYDVAFSKSHAHQDAVRSGSPFFFDVEADASSTAATSAAAIKEAMESAQATLKNAKESFERKRAGIQIQKKQGQRGSKKSTEMDGDQVAEEEIFKEVLSHKEIRAQSSDESQDMVEKRGFGSPQASYKLEKSGEWKSDDGVYKLTNTVQKYRNNAVAADPEEIAKRTKATRKHTVDEEAENPTAGMIAEVGKIEKLDNSFSEEPEVSAPIIEEVSAITAEDKFEDVTPIEDPLSEEKIIKPEDVWASESEEDDALLENVRVKELHGSEKASSIMMKETQNTMPETCVHLQNANKLDEVNYSHCEEYSVSEATQRATNGTEGSEMILEVPKTCKVDEIHGSEGRKSNLEVDEEEASGVENNEEELNTVKFASESCGSEKAALPGNGIGFPNEYVKVVRVHDESSLGDLAADQSEDLKESGIKENIECPQEANDVKLESSNLGHKAEKVEELNVSVTVDASKLTESESKVQATPNSDGAVVMDKQERSKVLEESVELHNVTAAVSEEARCTYTERKAKESQPAYAENGEEDEVIDPAKQDNSEEQTVNRTEDGEGECNVPTGGNVPHGSRGDDIRTNADTNICRVGVNTDMKYQQAAAGSIPCSTKYASAVTEAAEKDKSSLQKKEEKRRGRTIEKEREQERQTAREREQEKERSRGLEEEKEGEREREQERELENKRARVLEEEKEREREREKDRLAVERATREAHERAFVEAIGRVERIAMERITAGRQRAFAESREMEEKSYAEAYEKQPSEMTSREAWLRAEHAAVERATAEARERAIERAKAEKAAADAKERMDRLKSSFKESFKANNQVTHDAQFQKTSSGDCQSYVDPGKDESHLRYKARLERHQRIAEHTAKALAEKNMRDMLAQREQAERNRLAKHLDAEVKRWSNGKEGNLRALLSTLQYILGSESSWQPISLTDVITAVSVKKAYRKATLCVHPDKLQQRGASIQQKYICEKVFDLLKEAWNSYNSEER